MEEKIYQIERTAQNIDLSLRFLGEKADMLNELLNKFDEKCEMTDEVIALDEIVSDLDNIYELLNNLSEELKEQILTIIKINQIKGELQ